MRSLAAIVFVISALSASAADANIVVTIDKSTQRMTVQVDGTTRWTWPVSTGRRGHATPAGTFQAFRMERDHFSKEWDDAPMPHSIFFTKRGHAIHGSYETRRIGTAASAGCVRLHPENARRLFALVEQRGVLTTTVVVTGSEPRASSPAVARQSQPRRYEEVPAAPSYRYAPQPGYYEYR
jgi:lipoprotein-anchoring transpeptidase ErfK/SrfK